MACARRIIADMIQQEPKHRYRVTDVRGPQIAKLEVGTILRDAKPPEGRDDGYPNGYRTWSFMRFKTGETQDVTAEYIGVA